MAKFKVGDKVLIRHDLHEGYENDWFFVDEDMEKLAGEVATITDVDTVTHDIAVYEINLDDGVYGWTEDMFEEVAE